MAQIKCNKCNGYGCDCYPINQSNKTMVVPLAGKSAFEAYLAYHPDYPYDEKYWTEVTMRGNTPMQRISSTTGNWEVSYDNGETWIDLGTKAQGDAYIPEFSDDVFDI